VTNARAMTRAAVAGIAVFALLAGCSREKIDWKSAEAADTVEAYDRFLQRHPDGELAPQARARVAQLNEDRDWQRATTTDTVSAYRAFLAQHENGKWAEEARIRIENFALDGTATGPSRPSADPDFTVTRPGTAAPPPQAPPPVAPPAVASAPPPVPPPPPGPAQTTPQVSPEAAKAVQSVPAAPSPVTDTPAQFGIQLGAFRTREAALNSWKDLQVKYDSDLHGLFARAVPVQHSAGQLFRLQAPVGQEARARAICASLVRKSQPCVIVLPASQ
jgi:cell division septation protein DedD